MEEPLKIDQLKKEKYLSFLFESNLHINLISRKMSLEQVYQLLTETERLAGIVSGKRIIDAGSGNGILGIPMAIKFPKRKVVLLESKRKKADFLRKAAELIPLPNIEVLNCRLEDYRFHNEKSETSLVARGFPSIEAIAETMLSQKIKEAVMITSLKKIENLNIPLEKVTRTIYNIPFRDVIKILKMENVSRETK